MNPRSRSLLAALLALVVPLAGAAQSPRALRLADALDEAERSNADAVLARLHVDSARAERRIAAALPNPTLAAVPGLPSQYSVTVPLDVGPQRLFRVRSQRFGAEATAMDAVDARRLVRASVSGAFYDVLLAQTLRDVAREQRDVVREVLRADSLRFRAGDIPARDVVKTELELARGEAALTRADGDVRSARVALQLLIGRTRPDTGLAAAGELSPPAELPDTIATADLEALALRRRPDLLAAGSRVDAARASRSLARTALWQQPAVGVVNQPAAPFANGSHLALAVTLPVPLFDQFRGERARADASLEAARVAERHVRAQATAEVTGARAQLAAAAVVAHRYEQGILAGADSSLAITRYAYGTGAASLLELLDAIRTHAEVRAEYATAIHDLWLATFALDRATGAELVSP